MPFINLTPHEIYETVTGLRIPSTGIARVRWCTKDVAVVDGVQLFRSDYEGSIQGLPEPQDDVIYIVSALALNAVPTGRTDVVAPGNVVRNELGVVIGCAGFRCR